VYLSYAEAKYNVYFLKNNKEAIIGKKFYQLFTKKEKQKVMQFEVKKFQNQEETQRESLFIGCISKLCKKILTFIHQNHELNYY
jgi:hypothetical protein